MWNRIAFLAGAILALASLSPLRAQVVNPDCTGTGFSGPGFSLLVCKPTGCTVACVGESVSTPWGPATGVVCRCNIVGPPLNCCRLVGIKFPGGGAGYTTQGQCDFPSCNDTGNCWLESAPNPGGGLKHYAICKKPGVMGMYGEPNYYASGDNGGELEVVIEDGDASDDTTDGE